MRCGGGSRYGAQAQDTVESYTRTFWATMGRQSGGGHASGEHYWRQ
jgi:hypothetical protein